MIPNLSLTICTPHRTDLAGPVRLSRGPDGVDDWYGRYKRKAVGVGVDLPTGWAKQVVSYHYAEQQEQRSVYSALHERESWLRMDGDGDRRIRWVGTGKNVAQEMGGYSAAPKPKDEVFWRMLLEDTEICGGKP